MHFLLLLDKSFLQRVSSLTQGFPTILYHGMCRIQQSLYNTLGDGGLVEQTAGATPACLTSHSRLAYLYPFPGFAMLIVLEALVECLT